MQATLLYAISFASAIGFVLAWRLSQLLTNRARERLFSIFSKWAIYTIVWPRLNGSSDISVLAAMVLLFLFIGNVLGSTLAVRGRTELSQRLARLSIVNVVLLFLGGRTNLVIDRVFQFSSTEYHFLHRWVGRISVAEGIIHSILSVLQSSSTLQNIELSLLIVVGVIGSLSVLFVRRRIYEFFLGTHSLASIALLILLWLHGSRSNAYKIICISTAAAFYVVQTIVWLFFLLYRNIGSGPPCQASITRFPQHGNNEVVQIRVQLKRPWNIKSGQFVYLSMPRLRSFGLSLFERHPFMVSWSYQDEEVVTIVLLVQCRRGFTGKLRLADGKSYAVVDGPYGCHSLRTLKSYDTVLFLAEGIGIAAHLLSIKQLLLAHDERTARVRRITFVWLLETKDQLQWAEEFLHALHDMDHRRILNIHLQLPNEIEGSSQGREFTIKSSKERIYALTSELNMGWWVEQEWLLEAGNMLVTVCGSPQFELCARKAVRASSYDIAFCNSEFQPDGTLTSQLSSVRYYSAMQTW